LESAGLEASPGKQLVTIKVWWWCTPEMLAMWQMLI
jgi:hypothetical protein